MVGGPAGSVSLIQRARSAFNLSAEVKDLTRSTAHPLEALYDYPKSEPVLSFPVESVRSFWGVGLSIQKGWGNPFVETAMQLIENRAIPYASTKLAEYYDNFCPSSVSDLLVVDHAVGDGDFLALSPHHAVMPWWPSRGPTTPKFFAEAQADASLREFREHGGSKKSATVGLSLYGPTSKDKGRVELERLRRLVSSITKHGYQRNSTNDGDITGHLLVPRNGEVVVYLFGGLHRSAVLSALGATTIPVRLNFSIISRANYETDVSYWPHVVGGLYSTSASREIFGSYLEGRSYHPGQGLITGKGYEV